MDKQHERAGVQHASAHIVAHMDVPSSGSGMSKGLVCCSQAVSQADDGSKLED